MRVAVAAIVLLSVTNQERVPAPDPLVAAAKAVDVSSLDASLESQTMEEWISATAGTRTDRITWTQAACGLVKRRMPDTGLCVRAKCRLPQGKKAVMEVIVELQVASGRSDVGAPTLYSVEVALIPSGSASAGDFDALFEVWRGNRLSELPGLIEAARHRAARADQ